MNAHHQLERQLRTSVAHPAGPGPAPRPGLGSWPRGRSALIVAASTALALGVAVLALVALHHRPPPSSPTSAPATSDHRSRFGPPPKDPGPIPRNVDDAAVATAWNTAWAEDPGCRPQPEPPGRVKVTDATPSAAMLSIIPALSRPATRADRLPVSLRPGPAFLWVRGGEVYQRFIRRARAADERTFYLVPVAKIGRPPLSRAAADRCYRLLVGALRAQLPKVSPAQRAATLRYGKADFAVSRYNLETSSVHDGVFLFSEQGNGGGGSDGGQSPSTIAQTGMLGGSGGGTPPAPTIMDGIVPAGVTTVTLRFPAARHGHTHLPALSVTGDVVNNVFVIPIPTLFERGAWPTTEIWRSSSGTVIKTVDERPFHP